MKNFAFSKINYILVAISVVLIIVGFALMAGTPSTTEFNPDVFSFRRITLAPIVCMIGFFGMIVAIMKK
jgi:hypothetical protein